MSQTEMSVWDINLEAKEAKATKATENKPLIHQDTDSITILNTKIKCLKQDRNVFFLLNQGTFLIESAQVWGRNDPLLHSLAPLSLCSSNSQGFIIHSSLLYLWMVKGACTFLGSKSYRQHIYVRAKLGYIPLPNCKGVQKNIILSWETVAQLNKRLHC